MASAAVSVSLGASPFGGFAASKKHFAGDGRDSRRTARERIRERREIGHRRRLAAVERVLNCPAPSAGLEIDEIRHVAGSNLEAQRGTLDRRAIEELRVSPDRSDRRHLVDDDPGRRRAAQHRKKDERRIVAAALVDRRRSTFGDEIEADARSGRLVGAKVKLAVAVRFRLGQLLWLALARGP